MITDDRRQGLARWAKAQLGADRLAMVPASCDASFRRYWRLWCGEGSLIAMDAPPEKEDSARFVRIAGMLRVIGLNVPEILAADLRQGFLLISDLGQASYLDVLDETSVERLYGEALDALAVLQSRAPRAGLPPYDEALLRRELGIFTEWLFGGLLGRDPAEVDAGPLAAVWDHLVANALEQPRVCVHRDFHSRNLMASAPRPGILDFQDAVIGPVTYDLVSLLRDCYIAWPPERVDAWARGYLDRAMQVGILQSGDEERFTRWMDLMGIQRHLKAAGIFARLKLRDGRPGYLADIPRTLGYVMTVAPAYPELAPLVDLVGEQVLPACRDLLASAPATV
ncbi:aminoglycoside phosphotransferase family protein [Thiococcus pfennigii]|uniref:aminoglycoside phosphotransferase family protein n=1 Tax=Thiococcus pfennigii TaxID=1057 RepID=UPI001907B24D|nr:phosphotransferase [Thiococcus pfennigii]MBK1701048.1 aminoglycoside phosphotransferase [Thiococcus pfennigii]